MWSLGAVASAQQAGSIRGTVYEKDADARLAGAQVNVIETGQRAATSDEGVFVIGNVLPGRYTVAFWKEGYVRQVRSDVVVTAGRLTEVDAWLQPELTELEEYVVRDVLQLGSGTEAGLLQLRFEAPALMDSIGAELIGRAGATDAAGALRLVAGATVRDGKSAVIRGLPDRYVSSQLNGVRLPSADEDKRAVELDQFPAVVIESVEVAKTFTPDQQGDASGGAVDVRLRGLPDQPLYLQFRLEGSHNTQTTGRSKFLTYEGGGLSHWGRDDGRRDIQTPGQNWTGAVGVSRGDAPVDYKWSGAFGGTREVGDGVKVGGFVSFFYERDSAFYDQGTDDSWWVDTTGAPMTPRYFQGAPPQESFTTALYDVTRGTQSVQWGTLGAVGLETPNHRLNLIYLYTRTAEDSATLAEDTRGKEYFFPGYNPNNPSTPGHTEFDAAPYLRLETLEYEERVAETLQLTGQHKLFTGAGDDARVPELHWTLAHSEASADQPDKRQFGSLWQPARPGVAATHRPYKPDANFTLGNLQRTWKDIEETSNQGALDLTLPFGSGSEAEGKLKVGAFYDDVDRKFNQDSFSNFSDNSVFVGPFQQYWSGVFPFENHPITASDFDVDYRGEQKIGAWYAMADYPLTAGLSVVGGARFEASEISIVNDAESSALWFPPGTNIPTNLPPGAADVGIKQNVALPAIGLVYKLSESFTLRAGYSETVARQTFKELTPVIQQEYLGGPVFIGNPDLTTSDVRNYDLRVDHVPYEGGLVSVSLFHKDLDDPIEYVQKLATFNFTTAVNYPEGRLSGIELETRQDLGRLDAVPGMSFGVNATLIDSEVTLTDAERQAFSGPNIQVPISERDMTNAPEYLFNTFVTYDIAATGTQLALFYTLQGDTLVAGAAEANGRFVPSVYALEYDTLNASVIQDLGSWVKLTLRAKNLTNPEIETAFRHDTTGEQITKTSYRLGIDYSLSIGGVVRF